MVVLLAGVLPLLVSLAAHSLFGAGRRVHEPLHEYSEVTGSCIALAVALLLWLRVQREEGYPHLVWAAAALVAMGLIDGAHALAPFGTAWSWLRHGSTLAGGLLFALVWLPLPATAVKGKRLLIIMVAVMATAASVGVWWRPDLLPPPWRSGTYTAGVIAGNALGGLGFILAALFFLRRYLRQSQTEDLVFASHALLFGAASVFFGFTHVWAADWWVWHGFRLLAYAIVLVAAYMMVVTLYEEIAANALELGDRVAARTAELAASVKELEAFTYSVSHDLRAPLRQVNGFAKLLAEEFGPSLEPRAKEYLEWVQDGTRRMGQLVDDLLNLSRIGRGDLHPGLTGMNSLVREAIADLAEEVGEREIEWRIGELPFVECDPALMKQVWVNLLSNAIKFTRPRSRARIEVGQTTRNSETVMFVRDNGVGFSMKYAHKLFGAFQRLHREEDFEGTGIGLATVQRIIHKHGGRVWAEAELDNGATFFFTLTAGEDRKSSAEAALPEVQLAEK